MTQAAILAASGSPGTTTGFKNRIINGNMVFDQRNSGGSITPTDGQYSVDRWGCYLSQSSKYSVQQNAGAVTPPAGFTNYMGFTSLSAFTPAGTDYFLTQQSIEGSNITDLGFGTANAKTFTLSFWVRSSLTGQFGGAVANQGFTRCYPFSYTISAANTWQQVSITIAGDTSGTWYTNNTAGLYVTFDLGCGGSYLGTAGSWTGSSIRGATGDTKLVSTNGATWYVTGVQLEVGTTATNFDIRDNETEWLRCLRYYQRIGNATYVGVGSGLQASTTQSNFYVAMLAPMRSGPSFTVSNLIVTNRRSFDVPVTSISYSHVSSTNIFISLNHTGAGAQDLPILLAAYNSGAGYLEANSEM